jgi:hypothetical protein
MATQPVSLGGLPAVAAQLELRDGDPLGRFLDRFEQGSFARKDQLEVFAGNTTGETRTIVSRRRY